MERRDELYSGNGAEPNDWDHSFNIFQRHFGPGKRILGTSAHDISTISLFRKIVELVIMFSLKLMVQALASVGAILSGVVGGWVADQWGRKCSLMFSGVPIATGYLIISYAHYSPRTCDFVLFLYVGRLLTGVGMGSIAAIVGVSCCIHCMYVADMCSLSPHVFSTACINVDL